jgi:hypothetical protein
MNPEINSPVIGTPTSVPTPVITAPSTPPVAATKPALFTKQPKQRKERKGIASAAPSPVPAQH